MKEQTARTPINMGLAAPSARESDELLAVRGDAASFIRLYRTYVQTIYKYLYARLGSVQDAEDVTAQAFERAWVSLPRYKPNGAFKSWLFTIARRTLTDHYRQKTTHSVPLEEAEMVHDSALLPEDGALASEQVRQVLGMLADLNRDQQEVLALRFGGELRYDEIARVLNKRESAVKMIAYRALEEIRRRCQDV